MSFIGFLLLLIICFYLLRPAIRTWRALRQIRKQMNSVYEKTSKEYNDYSKQRKGGWSADSKPFRKKISKDVGEYVEFEEISVTSYQDYYKEETYSGKNFKVESQITDVSWEEIR